MRTSNPADFDPREDIDFIAGDNEFGESAASLDRYFLPFAIAARLEYEARSLGAR